MAKEEAANSAKKASEDQAMQKNASNVTGSGKDAVPLADDELEKASGGYYNDNGYMMTTVAYGCRYWEERPVWSAVRGQCGSCIYWDRLASPVLDAFAYVGQTLPCTNPNNCKK